MANNPDNNIYENGKLSVTTKSTIGGKQDIKP